MKRLKHPNNNLKRVLNTRGPKRIFSRDDLRAVEHLSKLGATNQQLADYFEVHIKTIEYWNRKYPEYISARKRGGIQADMNVAEALYSRAVGIEYIEEEFSAIEIDGKPVPIEKMRKVKRTKKWLPPDVKAATRWLTVRQRESWTVVPEAILRHTGNVNHLHRKLQDIPVQELTPASQQMLFEITQKQLAVSNNEN